MLSIIWLKLRLLKLYEKEEVINIPDAVIKTLPPYQQKDYCNIDVVTCPAASEKAVTDIRAELLQKYNQNGGNIVFNSYQFLGFCIRNMQQTPALLQIATILMAYAMLICLSKIVQ